MKISSNHVDNHISINSSSKRMREIKDPYLDDYKCIERLLENWREHGSIIIAFDFDNTIFDYYNKGYDYPNIIGLLKECKTMGCTLILYTCCDESKYEFMKEKCAECGIIIDYINESPSNIPFVGKKIYYNILLDDRAGLRSAYNILKKAKEIIKNEKF